MFMLVMLYIILASTRTPVLTEQYYELLNVPQKEFIWFERSGYNLWMIESSAFVDVIANKVLPETYSAER